MVSPTPSDEDDNDDGIENAWTDNEEEEETEDTESEELDDEAEIATADIHDENVRVDDDVGDINDSSSSDLSDAEINDPDETNDEELDIATANITEDEIEGDTKFGFDGEEDASDEVEEDDEEDGSGGAVDAGGDMASSINSGVASLGVIGIEDEETQESLRDDFERTAEDFRLGYYAEECVQEYFLSDDVDDISPVWGLVFASLVCAAVFALQRPDTEELGGKVSDAIDGIGEGLGGASS